MLSDEKRRSLIKAFLFLAVFTAAASFFAYYTHPVSGDASRRDFSIAKGEGAQSVAVRLEKEGLVRSALFWRVSGALWGKRGDIKKGTYALSAAMEPVAIWNTFVAGPKSVKATIPEGSNVFDIDAILANAGVIREGDLIAYAQGRDVEGRLFPDTYNFSPDSDVADVVALMLKNFDDKALPILNEDPAAFSQNLTIASMLEVEVPNHDDRKMVAGIIRARLDKKMPLQIDATVCYAKQALDPKAHAKCLPLRSVDFKIDSPYNTYLYEGLPAGPIGSPGASALSAAVHPQKNPYFFYLSDPATGKTIFSKTFEEHTRNRAKYLKI